MPDPTVTTHFCTLLHSAVSTTPLPNSAPPNAALPHRCEAFNSTQYETFNPIQYPYCTLPCVTLLCPYFTLPIRFGSQHYHSAALQDHTYTKHNWAVPFFAIPARDQTSQLCTILNLSTTKLYVTKLCNTYAIQNTA